MEIKIHKNARTTFALQREIKILKERTIFLMRKLNFSWEAVKKWKIAYNLKDRFSQPHCLRIDLTTAQIISIIDTAYKYGIL